MLLTGKSSEIKSNWIIIFYKCSCWYPSNWIPWNICLALNLSNLQNICQKISSIIYSTLSVIRSAKYILSGKCLTSITFHWFRAIYYTAMLKFQLNTKMSIVHAVLISYRHPLKIPGKRERRETDEKLRNC